jgi:hypothetical protein
MSVSILNRFASRTPEWSFDQGAPTLPDLGFDPTLDPTDLAQNYGSGTPTGGSNVPTGMPPPHHPTVADAISFPSRFLMTTGRIYGYANASPNDSTPSAVQARDNSGPAMGGFTPQKNWDNLFQQGQIDIPAQRGRAPGMSYSWDAGATSPSNTAVPFGASMTRSGNQISGDYGSGSVSGVTAPDGQPVGAASIQAGNQYKAQLQNSLATLGN